jgi:hypothetical protein
MRTTPRVPVFFDVLCEMAFSAPSNGRAYNLSSGGMCIFTFAPVSIREEVALEFPLPNASEAIKIVGEVAWCRVHYNGDSEEKPSFMAGIKFLNVEDHIVRLIGRYSSRILYLGSRTPNQESEAVPKKNHHSGSEDQQTMPHPYAYDRRPGKDRGKGRDRRKKPDRRSRGNSWDTTSQGSRKRRRKSLFDFFPF